MTDRISMSMRRARGFSNPPPLQPAPALDHPDYDPQMARLASKMLYRSGHDASGNPLLILSAASFPDSREVDYTELLPYVLALVPGDKEMELLDQHGEPGSGGYSVIFFAGGGGGDKDSKSRPALSWTLQAYHLLGRAITKRIKKFWVVHEKAWVRIMLEMLSGMVSSKFRKKIVHVTDLTDLATLVDITRLNIPPAVYIYDRKSADTIELPTFLPRPQFSQAPFVNQDSPLPQVLIDTTRYIRLHCLDVEGLFRIPPSSQLLEIVREAYDRRQFLLLSDYGPHIAAGLVKLFYRTLPEPVIPQHCYKEIQELGEIPEGIDLVPSVKTLLDDVFPKTSRRLLLQHLVPLLDLVASHSSENKMTSTNLAICFAPSFVRSDDMMLDVNISKGGVTKLIEVLIENIETFTQKMADRPSNSGEKIAPPTVKRSVATKAKKAPSPPPLNNETSGSPPRQAEATIRLVEKSPEAIRPVSKPTRSSSSVNVMPPLNPNTNTNGIPSPPPSPSSEIPDIPIEALTPQKRTTTQKTSPSSSPAPVSAVSISTSPPSSLETAILKSPPRVDPPQLRSLMRVATTPLPMVKFPSGQASLRKTSQIRSTSPTPQPGGYKPKLVNRAVSDSGPKIGKVKVTGRAVDELRALFEERAKEAEILVRAGSRRESMLK